MCCPYEQSSTIAVIAFHYGDNCYRDGLAYGYRQRD